MTRRRCRSATALLTLGAAVLTVAGCSAAVSGRGRMAAGAHPSASPTASPSPVVVDAGMIVLHARNAMQSHDIAVHGKQMQHGTVVTVDVATGWDAAAAHDVGTATVQIGGVALSVRGVGNTTWLSAPAAYWRAAGVADAAAQKLDGKWIVAPADDDSGLADLVNPVGVTDFVLPPNDADLTRIGSDLVGGTKVDVIKDTGSGQKFLITTGDQPLLLQVVSSVGRLEISYPTTVPAVSAPDPSQILAMPGG